MIVMMRESSVKEVILPVESLDCMSDIPLDLVVTITRDGKPLSRFADDVWDYSATSVSQKTLNFRGKIESILLRNGSAIDNPDILNKAITQFKGLILHWINAIGGCSISKLNGDTTALGYLVAHSLVVEQNVESVFSNPMSIEFMIKHISTEKQIGIFLAKIQRFVDTVLMQNINPFWLKYQPSSEFLDKLKNSRKMFPETTESTQTLLIPSNIYQVFLRKIIEDLTLFTEFKEKISYVFSKRALARDQGLTLDDGNIQDNITRNQSGRIQYYWRLLIEDDQRLSFILKELVDVGISKDNSWSGIIRSISLWQTRCIVLIAAFTGMRKNEILAIPLNGLSYLKTVQGNIPVVWSTTTKLEENGAPRFTKWVTSNIVQIAFDVARTLTTGILEFSGSSKAIIDNERNVPLFMSVEKGKTGIPHPSFDFTVTNLALDQLIKGYYRKELMISKYDIEELEWFLYGKETLTIQEGGIWPLALHQFRRSLAVYAAGSGKVSYPTLKSQLKHISLVMTTYYADSNSRAIDILSNDNGVKSLKSEWKEARARMESDSLYSIVNSDIPLSGIAGKKLSIQRITGELPEFLESRKETAKAVKNGKIRYRPTMVGGCMSQKPCNKGAGVLASACVSCENAVFLPGSREALIQTKEFYQNQLKTKLPNRAREEYELNIKRIDSFMASLTDTTY